MTAAAPPSASLREHLPGLETERNVTDWGRSELVEATLDRTLYDFLFHYWFRVQTEGLEHVPGDGPVLLVANRAGALPLDAAMIAKTIRHAHPRPRPVHFATERSLSRVPGLDMLLTKAGAVSAHPANLHRLLFDERALVLAFPEAGPGALRERYRLRAFSRTAGLQAAARARATVIPVAVLGAQEATPILGRLGPLRVPLSAPLPLPAKLRLRFLEPVPAQRVRSALEGHGAQRLAEDVRALIQENLLDLLAARRSVWLG